MNKKGIALSFLVTLVLGIFIFGTTAYIFSGMFRLSSRAEESFYSLTQTINSMKDRTSGEVESTSLIMDGGTAIAIFNPKIDPLETSETIVKEKDEGPLSIPRPNACNRDQACICLIKEGEIESISNKFNVNIKKVICNPLELTFSYRGDAPVITRSFIWDDSDVPRQRPVYIGKLSENKFILCEDPSCL